MTDHTPTPDSDSFFVSALILLACTIIALGMATNRAHDLDQCRAELAATVQP